MGGREREEGSESPDKKGVDGWRRTVNGEGKNNLQSSEVVEFFGAPKSGAGGGDLGDPLPLQLGQHAVQGRGLQPQRQRQPWLRQNVPDGRVDALL